MSVEPLMFQARSASLLVDRFKADPEELTISFILTRISSKEIRSDDGQSLSQATWSLYVEQERSSSEGLDVFESGELTFKSRATSGKPPICMCVVQYSPSAFRILLDLVSKGLSPSDVTICVEGLIAVNEGLVWETARAPSLAVSSVGFDFGLPIGQRMEG